MKDGGKESVLIISFKSLDPVLAEAYAPIDFIDMRANKSPLMPNAVSTVCPSLTTVISNKHIMTLGSW